jgi:uncharacterized protein (DUF2236 family)
VERSIPADFFAKDSVIRRVNSEPLIMLGAGRALLLQVAHPAIAQGVADHSNFRNAPFRRLQGTVEALNAIVFGTEELAVAVGRRVQEIHEHVIGETYRANDVDNLVWVHATLCDSALDAQRRFVGPISADHIAGYYEQMKRVAQLFGVPFDALPATWSDFRTYFDRTVDSLRVSEVGRQLAVDIVQPRLPIVVGVAMAPLTAVHHLVAIGTTPTPLRRQFGFAWGARQQHMLEAIETMSRIACGATPRSMRIAPTAISGRLLRLQARTHAVGHEP